MEKLPDMSEEFINQLSIFNERIIAFNSMLDQLKKINSANPITTERLIGKLNDLGINESSVEFDDFKKKIFQLKNTEEILHLAENNRRLNRVVHVNLIGNKNKQDKLHCLYCGISDEVERILNNFDRTRPYFVRFKWLFVVISVPLFLLIETVLR